MFECRVSRTRDASGGGDDGVREEGEGEEEETGKRDT